MKRFDIISQFPSLLLALLRLCSGSLVWCLGVFSGRVEDTSDAPSGVFASGVSHTHSSDYRRQNSSRLSMPSEKGPVTTPIPSLGLARIAIVRQHLRSGDAASTISWRLRLKASGGLAFMILPVRPPLDNCYRRTLLAARGCGSWTAQSGLRGV